MDGHITYQPGWKNALFRIRGGAYTYGDMIPTDELRAMLLLHRPEGKITWAQHQKHQLEELQAVTELRTHLLRECNMLLVKERHGYRILNPAEQTTYATQEAERELRKVLRDMRDRLVCIAHDKLTDDERKANADALARMGAMRQAFHRINRGQLPSVPKRLIVKKCRHR